MNRCLATKLKGKEQKIQMNFIWILEKAVFTPWPFFWQVTVLGLIVLTSLPFSVIVDSCKNFTGFQLNLQTKLSARCPAGAARKRARLCLNLHVQGCCSLSRGCFDTWRTRPTTSVWGQEHQCTWLQWSSILPVSFCDNYTHCLKL